MTADKMDDIKALRKLIWKNITFFNKYKLKDEFGYRAIRLFDFKPIAKTIIESGWIPRERAVEHCSVCKYCKGKGYHSDYIESCSSCNGTGIVLKESQ